MMEIKKWRREWRTKIKKHLQVWTKKNKARRRKEAEQRERKKGRREGGEDNVQKAWKENFENLYSGDTEEEVAFNGFDGARRGSYFGGEPIRRTEVEVRVKRLKNGKVRSKDEISGVND